LAAGRYRETACRIAELPVLARRQSAAGQFVNLDRQRMRFGVRLLDLR
jgi:hypothetical protein